jgi:hypothetical protein
LHLSARQFAAAEWLIAVGIAAAEWLIAVEIAAAERLFAVARLPVVDEVLQLDGPFLREHKKSSQHPPHKTSSQPPLRPCPTHRNV